MSCAEHLYTRGFISYPRTETTSYPKSFDFHSILHQLSSSGGSRHAQVASQLLHTDGISQPKQGEDKGDHPPITPLSSGGGLSGDHARIYDYVVSHFLATLMKPCRYLTRTVALDVGGEAFSVQSRQVIDPGFTSVMTWQAVAEEECLEGMREGALLSVKEAKLMERETSPPGYLTESELISLMEKYGIGTDASIPVHINNICVRNYVRVEAGRKLEPTKLGIALVRGYWRVDPELIQPTMRADVEKQLELIAKGRADYRAVLAHTLENFRRKFLYFTTNIGEVGDA